MRDVCHAPEPCARPMTALPSVLASGRDPRPGRMCPLDYYTDPAVLARAPDILADTLYIVGGLYGNAFALDAIEALAAAEPSSVTVVINGDAHWFDAQTSMFHQLEARLARYPAIAGNIEFELARDLNTGAGCGCAYPAQVSDDVVERSNRILVQLRDAMGSLSPARARLKALPKTLVAGVGGLRIGIVHGDPTSLAGWGLSRENLDDPESAAWLDAIGMASQADIFASTHTCGAVMRDLRLPSRRYIVANNGAAGMGNFDGDRRGLITRVSTRRSPHATLYGLRMGAVRVDALPVAFDLHAFATTFDEIWPEGSAAELSYRRRIHGEFPSGDAASARPTARGPHQRSRSLPASAPAAATSAMPMGYQTATKSGESSGQ